MLQFERGREGERERGREGERERRVAVSEVLPLVTAISGRKNNRTKNTKTRKNRVTGRQNHSVSHYILRYISLHIEIHCV